MVDIFLICYNIEDSASKLHDTERMLKPTMSCTWIEQIGQSELVNMPKPLERSTIKNLFLSWLQTDEIMDRIAYLLI